MSVGQEGGDVSDAAVRAAVETLLSEVFWYHDHGLVDEQLALYVPGFQVHTPGGTFSGADEYGQFLRNRHGPDEFSLHYVTNVRVTSADAERVTFRYYISNPLRNVAALGGGDVFGVAEGSDVAVWDQGRLRFVQREFVVCAVMGLADKSGDEVLQDIRSGYPTTSAQ